MAFDPAPILEYFQIMFIALLILIVLIPVISYVTFRAASLGWYKSRLEHFKKMLNHQEGDDQ